MAFTKARKALDLEKIQKVISSAEGVVFVNFHGLKVSDISAIRSALREKNVNYFVSKKTLLKKALAEKKIAGEMPSLDGEIAIAYGDDALSPTREIFNFQKKLKDSFSIVGGIYENTFQSKQQALAMATIPPREVLYGQLVGLLTSPMRGLVVSLSEIAKTKN